MNPNISLAARKRYRDKGPTGFLHTQHEFVVITKGRIVFKTAYKRDAERRYYRWCEMVPNWWSVELRKDGEVIAEHCDRTGAVVL